MNYDSPSYDVFEGKKYTDCVFWLGKFHKPKDEIENWLLNGRIYETLEEFIK